MESLNQLRRVFRYSQSLSLKKSNRPEYHSSGACVRRLIHFFILLLGCLFPFSSLMADPVLGFRDNGHDAPLRYHPSLESLTPISLQPAFEKNVGQADPKADYIIRGDHYIAMFTSESIVAAVFQPGMPNSNGVTSYLTGNAIQLIPTHTEGGLLAPYDQTRKLINSIKGMDQKSWHKNIPSYEGLKYSDLYPGINLVFRSDRGVLEFGAVLEPGSNLEDINIAVAGARELIVTESGNLRIQTTGGAITLAQPVAMEEVDGQRQTLDAHFVVRAPDQFGFEVPERTPGSGLTISPQFIFTTYFEDAEGVATEHDLPHSPLRANVDLKFGKNKNVYAVGTIPSVDLPADAVGEVIGTKDIFVVRFDPQNQRLVYSTFFGGTSSDHATAIAPAEDGSVYITGWSGSSDFPASEGVINPSHTYGGGFISKLSPDGEFSLGTLLGKSNNFFPNSIVVSPESSGGVFVAGAAGQLAFDASTSALAAQVFHAGGGLDGFVARIQGDLTAFDYFTFVGGSGSDIVRGLAVYDDTAYVAGTTTSFDFPITSDYVKQHTHNAKNALTEDQCWGATERLPLECFDGFIARLRPDGSGFIFSTYEGSSGADFIQDIAIDTRDEARGFAVVTGRSMTAGGSESAIVVARVNSLGGAAGLANLRLQAGSDSHGSRVVLDRSGRAHVTGTVDMAGFTTGGDNAGHYQGAQDMFYMRVLPSGDKYDFFTYLGDTGSDWGHAIDFAGDPADDWCVVVAGRTLSPGAGADNPRQQPFIGDSDLLLYGLCDSGGSPVLSVDNKVTPTEVDTDGEVTIDLTVQNLGTTTVNARMVDVIPEGLEVIKATRPCAYGASSINCDLEILAGQAITVSVQAKISSDCPSEITNIADLYVGQNIIASSLPTNLTIECPSDRQSQMRKGEHCKSAPDRCVEPLVCGGNIHMFDECNFPRVRLFHMCIGGWDTVSVEGAPRCMRQEETDFIFLSDAP